MDIIDLLSTATEMGASDLHLVVGVPPTVRLNGILTSLSRPPTIKEETLMIAKQLMNESKYQVFQEKGQVDVSYRILDQAAFRINIYKSSDTVGIAFRIISDDIPTLDSLGLPAIVENFSRRSSGLILVTGPTGSGKSTTIASMINLINEEKYRHIITLEDPIEYRHKHKKSIITQREIGRDCNSFSEALRSGLRQNPDVIMVGEMRDLETISTVMTAAETGHLVMATLHTRNAPQTIERIIDVFPSNQQQQIRIQLASSLIGVLSQRLLPRKDKEGRVALVEILVATPAIRNLIRESKIHQLYSFMQTGKKLGMQTIDDHLKLLHQENIIFKEDLLEYAIDQEGMQKYIESSFL